MAILDIDAYAPQAVFVMVESYSLDVVIVIRMSERRVSHVLGPRDSQSVRSFCVHSGAVSSSPPQKSAASLSIVAWDP